MMKNPSRQASACWMPKPLSLMLLAVFSPAVAWAVDANPVDGAAALSDVQFNPAFLGKTPDGKPLDLSRFSGSGAALPGTYRADVFVNMSWLGRRDVVLREGNDHKVVACFNRAMLDEMGVDFSRLQNSDTLTRQDASRCHEIGAIVPGALSSFNAGDLKLDVSIPQLYVHSHARGYVDPQYWDAGAPFAGFINYNTNAYRYDNGSAGKTTQYYLGSNAGLNIGEWRLRHNAALTQQNYQNQSGDGRHYQSISAYAQHDLTAWQSVLTVGDSFTPSDLFSSVGFRGAQINSDDRMLPESMQGYAPVVRGVAETNARVSIRQNGNLIYENTVPPGEFQINDLYNTGYAGDLNVTVTEADGRTRQFVVPYAAVPQLLRASQSRYSITAGQLRDESLNTQPKFIQATYQRGLNNTVTVYGGLIAAEHYQAGMLGVALNTPFGALASDVTQSQARDLPAAAGLGTQLTGQSYRVTYSKLLETTRTNFTVAAYRYSTEGYLEFNSYAALINQGSVVYRTRNKFQLNVDQPLAEGWGHVFVSGSTQDYWNQPGRDLLYQAGYSNSYKWGSFSVSAGRSKDAQNNNTTQYMLSISIPLGKQPTSPLLTASLTRDSMHNGSEQLALSGSAGEMRNISYNAYASANQFNGRDGSTGGGGNLQYATSAATFSAGASSMGNTSQQSLGVSGALVFHPGGVTAAQSLGESIAVIEAPGAEGAMVNNVNGVRVNHNGYAVVTNLMPYRQNDITLDPKGMNEDVELQETSSKLAPRSGAIAMVKFPTQQGKPMIVHLRQANGDNLPVGASVQQADGTELAMVGQGGRTFLRGQEGKPLHVSWGAQDKQQCSFSYVSPLQDAGERKNKGYLQTEAICQ